MIRVGFACEAPHVALVTGAGGGIGSAVVRRFLDAGAKVARAGEILVWQPAVLPKSPRWLATLRRAARELGERAVVAPLLSYEDGSVYFGGGTSGAAPAGAPCSLVGFARRRLDDSGPRPAQALPAEIVLVNRDLDKSFTRLRSILTAERLKRVYLPDLERFVTSHRGDIARDLDNDPVFLAPHEFGLNYEADRWKAIRFDAVKDYQVGAKDKAA